MLGKPSQGFLGTSSLISLVPRQVMLEGCSVVAAAGGAQLAEKKTKKRRKGEQEEKKGVPLARAALLRAIAAFLEGGGFSRTLAALRSEAQLEIDDGSEYPVLDLEEIICSYLESSKDPVVGNITGPEEQDAQKKAPRKEEEGTHDHSEEPICKKKKKKAKGSDDNLRTESDKAACDNGDALPNKLEDKLLDHETAENQLTESHMESKEQKRKKSKKVPKEIVESGNEKLLTLVKEKLEEVVPSLENASSVLDETNVKFKDKKKKKNKLTSDSPCGEVNQVEGEKGKSKESERKTDSELPTFATENAASENPMEKDNSKSKDKKKRKHNPMVENSCRDNVEVQNGSMSNGGKKGKSVSHDLEEDANGSDKKTGNISSPPNTGNIDKKAKKRKRSASEETELHVDDDASVQEPKQKKPENLKEQTNKGKTENLDDSLLNNDLHTSGKKKKSEKSEYNSEMTASTPVKQSELPKNAKETPAAGISQSETKGQQEVNGNLAKNECEGNGSLKSKKADFRHSAEPKTVNAFQRVKADEVEFADERLQDNSYWAKDGAETGYGAKAQEVLGQVRGRDFRHEKTKKKRGSYRGGQIDFQSHSVKFQYSDDEE